MKDLRENLGEKLFSGNYLNMKTISKLTEKMDKEFPLYVDSFLEIIGNIDGVMAKLSYPVMNFEEKVKFVSSYLVVDEHRIIASPKREDLMAFLSHELVLDVLEVAYRNMHKMYSISVDEFIILWVALVQTGKIEELAAKHLKTKMKEAT